MGLERSLVSVEVADDGEESAVISLGTSVPVGLILPSGFVTCDLTFQGSFDGVNYFDLQWENGGAAEDVIIAGAAAGKLIVLDPVKFLAQSGGPLTLGLITRFFQ